LQDIVEVMNENEKPSEPTAAGPFESIEGAHEYLGLLLGAILEATSEVEEDLKAAEDPQFPRRQEALRLVQFKLQKLEQHIKTSRRLLNDLRSLKRLLLEKAVDTLPANRNQH
jgi:hypothetical protein